MSACDPVDLPMPAGFELGCERLGVGSRREAGDLEAVAIVILTPNDPSWLRSWQRLIGAHVLMLP